MTRRESLRVSLGGMIAARGEATRVAYRDYSLCLPDYLRGLAAEAYRTRNAALANLTTKAAIEKRQHWVRETFWKLAGGMPQRTPLRARTVGTFERPGYRVEKVVYESQPEFYVTANLYLPAAGSPPYPGVLFQMGHTLNGKAGDLYQKCCQGLARLGYVVLAFDPMGQGERTYYPGPNGLTKTGSADDEHTYPGKQMLLVGDTATRMQVWDAVRSLDYLAGRPEVDAKRLASTGQSGGATITMLLAAVDDRLAAAAVASGNTENMACAHFNPPGSTDDAEQDLIGSGPLGFDRWDLLYPIAPKPLLIIVSAKDSFGTYSPRYLENGREEFARLERVYAVLGRKERIAWEESPQPHGLTYYERLLIYNWFERWLKGSEKRVDKEPDVAPEPDRELWVGATGNAIRDFASTTPFQIVRRQASAVRTPDRADLDRLAASLGIAHSDAVLKTLARVPSGEIEVRAIETTSGPGVWVPAWVFAPRSAERNKPGILLLEERGRNVHWHEGALCETLAARGRLVCAADPRGIGDLRPEVGRGAPGYSIPHDAEEDFAWASLIFGRPLLGQRVNDIIALVNALGGENGWVLAANGRLAAPAILAALFSKQIRALYLARSLGSLRGVVESEEYRQPLANLVFGMLSLTDFPPAAGQLAPRRVYLAEPLDAVGEPLSATAARALYRSANVEIVPESQWSVDRLLSL